MNDKSGGVNLDRDGPSTIRLATERHCISLSKRNYEDRHSVSIKRLPSSKTGDKRGLKQNKEKLKSVTLPTNDENCTCISHSCLCLRSNADDLFDIEVFAIAREYQPSSNEVATAESKPSHVKTKSETSICGVSSSDSVKDDVGSTTHDDGSSKTLSYELLVKCRVSLKSTESNDVDHQFKTTVETIPLNFRPSIVHLTEIDVSDNEKGGNKKPENPAIGIYLTRLDDNKLRLYTASRKSLCERRDSRHNPVKPSSFTLASLSFNTTNQNREDTTDTSLDDPFIFRSSITALDAYNERLAVALFDGTIHIMTHYLRYTGSPECIECQMHRSTFIVDGPVTTLHFGELDLANICTKTDQETMSRMFLVAGSLCGFAALFYEMSPAESTSNTNQEVVSFFDGPLPLVDELYDPINGGEDCVTAVHACRNDAKPMIAVGTQQGRVLLFQRTTNPKYAFDESSFLDAAGLKQREVACTVTKTKSNLNVLQSVKDKFQVESDRLESLLVEVRREFESVESSQLSNVVIDGNDQLDEEGHEQSEDFIGDIHVESFLLLSRIQSLETELLAVRGEISVTNDKIHELQCDLLRLESDLKDVKNATITTLHSSVKKMHRYEMVCQHRLSYPVHWIHYYIGELIVLTRRTFHVFEKKLSNSASVEDKLALFEKKLTDILKV
jgi:hypothetical protein